MWLHTYPWFLQQCHCLSSSFEKSPIIRKKKRKKKKTLRLQKTGFSEMKIVSSQPKNRDFSRSEWKIDKTLKFYYRGGSKSERCLWDPPTLLAQLEPLKHGNVAPKWTKRGRTRPILIVLKYKVADFVFFLRGAVRPWFNWKEVGGVGQERENQCGERRGWSGKRRLESVVVVH